MSYHLEQLVSQLRSSAVAPDASAHIEQILRDFISSAETARAAVSHFTDDDVILFEDEQISIWFCRFQPGATVPPHNHKMAASIGVFQGTERNDMFARDSHGQLTKTASHLISEGQVFQIGADAIHGVSCVSEAPSQAIHVYRGALSMTDRDLFDVRAGTTLAFTDENYHKLTERS